VPNPTDHYFLSGRVFHDYGQANQVWVGYSLEHRKVTNQGVGGTVLPEAGVNTMFVEHEVNVGHVYAFSKNLLNQLHFLVGYNNNQTQSLNENAKIVVSGAFTGGGAQADFRRTEYHFDGTDIVTYTKGKQVMKFGWISRISAGEGSTTSRIRWARTRLRATRPTRQTSRSVNWCSAVRAMSIF
jgi:hypothetical protein